MAEIANYGTASVRRIYADWTNPSSNGWKACLLEHSLMPMQRFAYTTGKNSTDGAMIIDAMDLLYTGRFNSFCIVSSDSDFTRLAARIREQGVSVYGFGERKTNKALIAACDKFMYFDALKESEETPAVPQFPKADAIHAVIRSAPIRKPIDAAALNKLAIAIANAPNYRDNWVNLAEVGNILSRISPDLNARNYGYERLREFVKASDIVDLDYKDMGNKPPIVLVRLK